MIVRLTPSTVSVNQTRRRRKAVNEASWPPPGSPVRTTADCGPSPAAFTARMRNRYAVPFMRPVTV